MRSRRLATVAALVAALLGALAGCPATAGPTGAATGSPAARPARPAPAVAPGPASPCVDPLDDARRRLGVEATRALELDAAPPDLDGDGLADLVVRAPGDREPPHLLYVRTRGCPRFVGRVDAFMLACDGRGTHGLCDLAVDTWLLHGDRLRTRWVFDGRHYVAVDGAELVPGPRK
jgi:hypothetical protein